MPLTVIWEPNDARTAAELAATFPSVDVAPAPVVDLFTRTVLR
jgi:hypothetical protein